ncbi:MAG: TlpA disulfide reductase family protein [Jejuia sp.]
MKFGYLLVICVFTFSCGKQKGNAKLENGRYRAELAINDSLDIPFIFEVHNPTKLSVFNAEEDIEVTEITYSEDSVYIQFPVFEGYITAKIEENELNGHFVKPALKRVMQFNAKRNDLRFSAKIAPKADVSGNWETIFSPNSEEDKYLAKGIFKQEGQKVTGTFRTTTGDYRFLEGVLNGSTLQLSTFDGAHAFLFKAEVTDSTMNGMFYSGNHWKELFIAKKNESYELPDANTLTFLKEGYDEVAFSFKDEDGNLVSLDEDRFKNKIILLQIMGTWCPNCLDESRYYSEFYKNGQNEDLEIIALAFEYVKSEEKAFENIKRLRENTGITYPILLAQYGSASKVKANEKLPMLNHVLSYPTTIFIDKAGKVRKIHTGFNGPATGEKYLQFKNEFEDFVEMLLSQ